MLQNFVSLLSGFQVALAPENIGACLLGAVLGLVVGAMPGIGSLAGCALLLPLTYKFNPTTAIIMLGALYYRRGVVLEPGAAVWGSCPPPC